MRALVDLDELHFSRNMQELEVWLPAERVNHDNGVGQPSERRIASSGGDHELSQKPTYGKWPIREISQQKSSVTSQPSSLRVGRCVSERPTATDVEEATRADTRE
jgi:hypothetical protein